MALFKSVQQYGSYGYIIEDPDPKYNRVFIENAAYNVKDLSVRNNEYFQFQNNALQVTSYNAMSTNWYDWPVVDTNGKFGNCWSDSRQNWPSQLGNWDPWVLCLDYETVPRRIIYDNESDMTYFCYPRDMSTTDVRSDLWHGRNLNSTPLYSATTQSHLLTHLYKFRKARESTKDNAVSYIAINHDYTSHSIFRVTYTPGAVPVYTNIRGATTEIPFFIGNDDNGYCYFLVYNVSTHNYDIFSYGNFAEQISNTSRAATITGGGLSNQCYQLPSNIKHDSDNRKVIYSSHWNSSNILIPKRIIWHKASSRFLERTCTMVYPGANTYATYGAQPTANNYAANTSNSWWMKPHVFSKAGVNYITFCTAEKCIHGFPTERWNASQQQRNWITYTIGTGENDHILTYHSHYSWPTAWEMPRSWVPINAAGDRMVVMQTGKTVTLSFNATTGWTVINTQSIDARAYALDSAGRIYLITRGQAGALQTAGTADAISGNGWNEIHLYDPDLNADQVNVSIANNLQNYTGTPIQTNLTVSTSNRKLITSYNSIDRFNPYPYSPFTTGYSFWFQNANSDRIVTANNEDFNFRTGNFTIEFWMRSTTAWTSQTGNVGIVGHKYSDTTQGWQLFRHTSVSTDKLTFRFAGTTDLVSTAIPDATVWQHWAIVRNSGVITMYCNGVASGTTTNAADIYDYVGQLNIGFSQTWSVYYNGWISNLRICKGLAVYTGNFTVPTATLQATQSAGTNIAAITNQCVLLTANANNIEDNNAFSSKSLFLKSSNSSLRFGHGTLSGDTVVTTSTLGATTVPITITGAGAKAIKVGSAIGPTFTTNSGPLHAGNVYEGQSVSYTIQSTGDTPIVYSLESGSLPSGLSLNGTTGVISGTLPAETTTTVYYFTIRATDTNGYYTGRQFSITNTIDEITWSTPTANQMVYFQTGVASSLTLSASSALSNTITYSTTSTLPAGITLSGNTLSGTASVSGYDSNVVLTATTAVTNTVSTRTIRLLATNTPTASGGTTTTVTEGGFDYRVHTFTSSGTLQVTIPTFVDAQILVVAGGGNGGGSSVGGGGGGGGGMMFGNYPLSAITYTVTVGGAGANSSITSSGLNIYTVGGGAGGSSGPGGAGGSGGGGRGDGGGGGGATTQFSTYGYGFGNVGGSTGTGGTASGGGGAGGTATGGYSSTGGVGRSWPGNNVVYARGGNGAWGGDGIGHSPEAANTGNGGGGADGPGGPGAGAGGSGIVIFKYRIT